MHYYYYRNPTLTRIYLNLHYFSFKETELVVALVYRGDFDYNSGIL
jgi:hypothetical protein